MQHQTPEQYYDPAQDNLGNYQYTKLSEVIDDFVLQSHDTISYLYGLSRTLIVRHAKAAVRKLNTSAAKEIKALELSVGDDLIFKLPQDYVNYVRISKVLPNNVLVPLDINTNLNISTTYLQDNSANIIFDGDGDVVESDGNNLTNRPYRSYEIQQINLGGQFQTDTSKFTANGEFVINQRLGVIYFNSQMAGKDVVLEYTSDGVEWERIEETEITFHKDLTEAMQDLIYYNCIERRTNVPANEKYRAENKFKASEHQAIIIISNFDVRAIERVLRKGSVWVK
jgi:hypothetical protein